MDNLLTQIEAYIAENGLSEWQFGERAVKDRHLVRDLRRGRDLRLSTASRIIDFMAGKTEQSEAAHV